MFLDNSAEYEKCDWSNNYRGICLYLGALEWLPVEFVIQAKAFLRVKEVVIIISYNVVNWNCPEQTGYGHLGYKIPETQATTWYV